MVAVSLSVSTDESSARVAQLAEAARVSMTERLHAKRRVELGQFFTPFKTARLLASMFSRPAGRVRLLDAGAGVGSLTAAYVERAVREGAGGLVELEVVAFEVDPALVETLESTLATCAAACAEVGIAFRSEVRACDFLDWAESTLSAPLFHGEQFTAAILNPPYRKIRSDSKHRQRLRSIGIETSNLYTAFVAASLRLMAPGGELVSITPRSFCNGPYFRPFREDLLARARVDHLHVFESRSGTFSDDEVLQENVVMRCTVGAPQADHVTISSSYAHDGEGATTREAPYAEVVHPHDADRFIHIAPAEADRAVSATARGLASTLADLGLTVSTGRVVDFRARAHLLPEPVDGSVPLIYPGHMRQGVVSWPRADIRKPNALRLDEASWDLTVPPGVYVLVRRFSAKEERRRIVAAVFDSQHVPAERVGLENHLNYYHREGASIPRDLAWGLCLFLNSTLVDDYFRQFSGHTQVNATDLRKLPYPAADALAALGARAGEQLPEQADVDRLVAETLL